MATVEIVGDGGAEAELGWNGMTSSSSVLSELLLEIDR